MRCQARVQVTWPCGTLQEGKETRGTQKRHQDTGWMDLELLAWKHGVMEQEEVSRDP